jgi:5'-nucleotidase/UDP-sugar diphosphatase
MLGLLATLAGIFLGVLSMKLLVPRPPAGTGPDVHADVAATEPHDLVEPPRLADLDRVEPGALEPSPEAIAPSDEPAGAPRPSRFAPVANASEQASAPPSRQDPFVAPASLQEPQELLPAPQADLAAAAPTKSAAYIARPGDSWWSLAERAYGDGRHYRALFAWNRAVDPRVSLVPGTSIEIPPAERLQAAWPALLPQD